ncbi:YkgJ family cysteine cluster protein [Pigmentiphaga soli]|uniref:YkgJ family cysteine cluster protein n=1 Tax=Pigmentiphaga soli TaxID=1007095 RepID=A0ABP8HP77_9BURK
MNCRERCGACCIAPSISSPIPGMPGGKPAGVRCVQLDHDERCRIFGHPDRPAVCGSLQPDESMCGESREQALRWLGRLERMTAPAAQQDPDGNAARDRR